MLTALILSVLMAPLSDSITPLPPKVSLVENSKVESTQVTIEVDKATLEELEKLGNVLEVVTVTQDKFPKPNLSILADGEFEIGGLVLLKLEGEIPSNVQQVEVTWKIFEVVPTTDGKDWNWKEKKVEVKDKDCFFGTGRTRNKFLAIANITFLYLDGTNFTSTSNMTTQVIKIEDGSPLPNPIPVNPVNPVNPINPVLPEPTFVPGLFNGHKTAYEAAKQGDKLVMSKVQAELLIKAYDKTIEALPNYRQMDAPLNASAEEDINLFYNVLKDHRGRVQKEFADAKVEIPSFWTGAQSPVTKLVSDAWNNNKLNNLIAYSTLLGEFKNGLLDVKARTK